MQQLLSTEPLADVDYISVADPHTLQEWDGAIPRGDGVLFSLAVYIGKTRLIDNFLLNQQ
jgi:pantoate--beta-alanine ligase